MAIVFDSAGVGSVVGGTSVTYSHTCTGSNLTLFVSVRTTNALVGPNSVAYNGVAMNLIANQTATGYNISLYYLQNPATGAHNVAVTFGTATVSVTSASYTGTNQVFQPDAFNKSASSSTSVTVVNSGCWLIGTAGGTGITAGGAFIERANASAGGNIGFLEDSNGTVSTGANTVDFSGTVGVCIGASIAPIATTLYWVGGTGNWDNATATHWSGTSGGTGGFGIPTSAIAVIFDGSSGGGTTTVSDTVSCASLLMTGYGGTMTQSNPLTVTGTLTLGASTTFSVGASLTLSNLISGASSVFSGSSALAISGSLTLASGMTLSYSGAITFNSTSSGKTITSAGKTILSVIVFNGVAGGWTLQDALTVTGASITLTNGTLNLNNQNVSVPLFLSSNSNARALTMGSGTVSLTGTGTAWDLSTSTSMTLTANTSTINFTNSSSSAKTFAGGSLIYYNFTLTTGSSGTYAISGNNVFHNLYMTGSGSGALTISGNNTYSDFKVDTPPHTVNFGASKTQTVTTFTVTGTAGNLMTLQSTSAGTQWILNSHSGITTDYLSIQDSRVALV